MNFKGNENAFNFPHKPYEIQTELMNSVYDCLDKGKIGFFESPTGTVLIF
jgi:chromosome transmission fidelity protein 1